MQIPFEWVGRASGIGLLAALILRMCVKPLVAYVENPKRRWLKVTIGAVLFMSAVFCAACITDKIPEHTDQSVTHFLFAFFTCTPVGLLGALMVYGATATPSPKTTSE